MKSQPEKPCPWCGTMPEIIPWHGGGPRKTLVGCYSESCDVRPSATASTRARAIRKWDSWGERGDSVSAIEECPNCGALNPELAICDKCGRTDVCLECTEEGDDGHNVCSQCELDAEVTP